MLHKNETTMIFKNLAIFKLITVVKKGIAPISANG